MALDGKSQNATMPSMVPGNEDSTFSALARKNSNSIMPLFGRTISSYSRSPMK